MCTVAEQAAGIEVVERLERKMSALLARIEQCETYRVVSDSVPSPQLVAAIVKHILLEVFSYGPHVTEATFTAIGRMPKNRPDLMRSMILHDLSEVDHGEMALGDSFRLGGDESFARSRRMAKVVTDLPRAAEAVEYGFDCFAAVYPLPIWEAALDRANIELSAHDGSVLSTGGQE